MTVIFRDTLDMQYFDENFQLILFFGLITYLAAVLPTQNQQ